MYFLTERHNFHFKFFQNSDILLGACVVIAVLDVPAICSLLTSSAQLLCSTNFVIADILTPDDDDA